MCRRVFTPPAPVTILIGMNPVPVALIAAAVSMTIGQIIKILAPVFKGKPPAFGHAFQSGGMPSSHTAACAAMTFAAGLREGFGSSLFAIAAVLTAVVAHDAVRVRGALNSIIRILRDSASEDAINDAGGLPDTVGHSVAEVAAGFVLAAVTAVLCHIWLP